MSDLDPRTEPIPLIDEFNFPNGMTMRFIQNEDLRHLGLPENRNPSVHRTSIPKEHQRRVPFQELIRRSREWEEKKRRGRSSR